VEDKAALKIQKIFRGHLARINRDNLKNMAISKKHDLIREQIQKMQKSKEMLNFIFLNKGKKPNEKPIRTSMDPRDFKQNIRKLKFKS